MIIDTHTHIYLNKKLSEEKIINWLKKDWIEKIISIWIDIEASKKSIELAKKNPNTIYATIWIHPLYVDNFYEDIDTYINLLEKMYLENKDIVKWIWECWYDFHYSEKEKVYEKQKIVFTKQIRLAKKYNLPIIIHTRNAKKETLETLKEEKASKYVLHCFSEDLDFALESINYAPKSMISFSWIVSYKNALNVQKTRANIDLHRILIETDCPYLRPQEVRWTENIPNNCKYILNHVYNLRKQNWKNETFDEVKETIYRNSCEFFDI